MDYRNKYVTVILGVSLLVLLTCSCSGVKSAQRKLNAGVAMKDLSNKELDGLEELWAKNQVFTENEKDYIGFSSYDFFSGRKSVRINIDSIAKKGTFPFNGVFSSDFGLRGGRRHNGVDISARNGARDIHAMLGGVVRISVRMRKSFGNVIVIRHQNGLETLYAHNRRNLVRKGDVVKSGDIIAIVGNTGRSTGAHLHFEVRVNGISINPNYIINPREREFKRGDLFLHKVNNKIVASRKANIGEQESKGFHYVKAGETIWGLSKKYNLSIKELCKINKISTKSVLRIGQRLRVT